MREENAQLFDQVGSLECCSPVDPCLSFHHKLTNITVHKVEGKLKLKALVARVFNQHLSNYSNGRNLYVLKK